MAIGFPLYIDLTGNNCTVFGGNQAASRCVRELLLFQAQITVISPDICEELKALSEQGKIRHIPRKYFRGDCSNAQLCVAATDDPALNIAIATECKAKSVPVNVTNPKEYGNFQFPYSIVQGDVVVSVAGNLSADTLSTLHNKLSNLLPTLTDSTET
ncbi:MAG: bifunctional precorrin-2 dehydrogenase/sirohydrochlorin ferrochelatase [Clostridia bacterium]|nr:bifunctional precorrin-2 dehydrogenase/sirohydrochlorin ferrochelatase [Clostridia bacterium]